MVRPFAVVLPAFIAVMAFAVACGGGGDGDAGKGQRVTDPGTVPSATPMQNPVIYQIKGDTISTSGGSTTIASSGGGTPASGAGAKTHTVVSGDTCGSIASGAGITVDALIRANRSINESCSNLALGDQLRIPGATPAAGATSAGTARAGSTAASGKTYTVRPGDTCGAIAANQGVEVARIISLNGLDAACSRLQVGQVLNIP